MILVMRRSLEIHKTLPRLSARGEGLVLAWGSGEERQVEGGRWKYDLQSSGRGNLESSGK